MRWLGILLLVILTLPSCEEEVLEVSFRIKTEGFLLENSVLGTGDILPSFSHRVSGGVVTFTRNGQTYEFDLEDTGIEQYLFQLPLGDYLMEITNPPASLYGQRAGSFHSNPYHITITEWTDTITVLVEATCALFLVNDEMNQLEEGVFMIERHSYAQGYFWSYPLEFDTLSGLYFTYFTPDTIPSDPSAFLWFYEGVPGTEEGGLPTTGFEVGYQYYIRILE